MPHETKAELRRALRHWQWLTVSCLWLALVLATLLALQRDSMFLFTVCAGSAIMLIAIMVLIGRENRKLR